MDVGKAWQTLAGKFINIVDIHTPVSKVRNRPNQQLLFIDKTTRIIIRKKKKHSAWNKYVYCNRDSNFEKYKRARNAATNAIRLAKYNYEKELSTKINTNGKIFWNYVRKNHKTTTTIGNILDKDDKLIKNDETKANVFDEYFASVFKKSINMSTSLNKRNYQSTLDDMEITEDDVLKVISEINPNKSIGPDNIHLKAIVECKLELSNPLTIIFNKSLNEERIPEIWKTANVTPIYKSGTKEDPGNYRPISISPVCSNIMQKILRKKRGSSII